MENLEWGLKMTVLGMGLVFALLGLLWGLLTVVLMLDKEPEKPVSPLDATAEAERIAAVKQMHKLIYRQGLTLQAARAAIAELAQSAPQAGDDAAMMERFLADATRGIAR